MASYPTWRERPRSRVSPQAGDSRDRGRTEWESGAEPGRPAGHRRGSLRVPAGPRWQLQGPVPLPAESGRPHEHPSRARRGPRQSSRSEFPPALSALGSFPQCEQRLQPCLFQEPVKKRTCVSRRRGGEPEVMRRVDRSEGRSGSSDPV